MRRLLFRIAIRLLLLVGLFSAGATDNGGRLCLPPPGGKTLLHSGWYARRASEVRPDGNRLTAAPPDLQAGWLPARVPGTVLTTLLANHRYPAPEFGLNNELIPDIHEVGNDFYTYWFVRTFELDTLPEGRRLWLNFRGINYRAEIFLNGKRLNPTTHEGMFLRRHFEVTPYLRTDSANVLAVWVSPPTHPGNPNGGQGGDGQIARNNTMQYTPGWDWIQPVRDRNTGIWDEVSLTTTGDVRLEAPHVVTKVPGERQPGNGRQADAFLLVSAELMNLSGQPVRGTLRCETDGRTVSQPVTLAPKERRTVSLPRQTLHNPRLWWPNGIGDHPLYDLSLRFETGGGVSDSEQLRYGVREIRSDKCPENGGRRFFVNGRKIYMTGGNYINSDWLLRLSPERYRDEVRFHAEMNLRMIRVWGGALVERPAFYDACDEQGILVFQDLWGSGDCNGAWEDPTKQDSRARRWEYPDNHDLFIASVADQVKMIRNHPSLCFWCGANEWPLAQDIDRYLKEELFPKLDPERLFVSYSTDTLFTRNLLGDNGDGPYGIREPEWFFTFRSHPFNPEAGSVGSPEIESMREMMTEADLAAFPRYGKSTNYTWRYHKDLGYLDQLERYGAVDDIETYCKYAQAVNYDQYRSFMEGWASKMWDWYTGILIWKTQNPWTALRGQMYDWYLDVNASLYGTRAGCTPLHPYYNPVTRQAGILNTTLDDARGLTLTARLYDLAGHLLWEQEATADAAANSVREWLAIPVPEGVTGSYFLRLALNVGTPNVYWLTTREKDHSDLARMPQSETHREATLREADGRYLVTVRLAAGEGISFFNRLKLFDRETGRRILPVHYSDNYITLLPGDERTVCLDLPARLPRERLQLVVDSWTDRRREIPLH